MGKNNRKSQSTVVKPGSEQVPAEATPAEAVPVLLEATRAPRNDPSAVTMVKKEGCRLVFKINSYWPGSADADYQNNMKALFYKNETLLQEVDLDAEPKAVEFEFKAVNKDDLLKIYVMDNDCTDRDDENTMQNCFRISDYFVSDDRMVYDKTYETVLDLYSPEDDGTYEGTLGENDLEADKGENPYIATSATLSKFTYEVKEAEKKPRAGRASRSPQRAGRSSGTAASINNKSDLQNAVKKNFMPVVDAIVHYDESNYQESLQFPADIFETHAEYREHGNGRWGRHEKGDNHFPEYSDLRVQIVSPKELTCGLRSIPDRNFIGGHYVSVRWEDCQALEDEVLQRGRLSRFDSASDSRQYADGITNYFGHHNHHRNFSCIPRDGNNDYFFDSLKNVRPIDEKRDQEAFSGTDLNECNYQSAGNINPHESDINVYCPELYQESYKNFKRFNFDTEQNDPHEDSWDITPIKNEYERAAQRNGAKYDIPKEKAEALAYLDREIAAHSQVDDNQEANNKLQETLQWLRKRQTDVIALENRQTSRMYDLDSMAHEIEILERHAKDRETKSIKLQKDTTQDHAVFGHDVRDENIPQKISRANGELVKEREKLQQLKRQQHNGCMQLHMEPNKECKELYTSLLAKDEKLN